MNIKSIASSSRGNAYLVSDGATKLLIECGLPYNQLKQKSNFVVPSGIDACLISHEHQDHSRSLKDLLKAGVDCYALREVFTAKNVKNHHRAKTIEFGGIYSVGTFYVMCFEAKHDVPCCSYYVYSTVTGEHLFFATDTYLIKAVPKDVNYIMIEANYDIDLVEDDAQRKRLIQSHMSIEHCIDYLKKIDLSKVKKIYLMHLSSRHSNADDFKRRVQAATGCVVEVCEE